MDLSGLVAEWSLTQKINTQQVDVEKAEKLLNQIDLDTKNEKHWETTLWTIPLSELLPEEEIESSNGTFVIVTGTGGSCRKRFSNSSDKCGGNGR